MLPETKFPELFVDENDFLKPSYVLPEKALAEVKLSDVSLSESEQCFQVALQAYQSGYLEAAVQHYQRGLDLNPHQMTARYQLGIILVELQQWQAGIEQLTKVIEERSNHVEAHNDLGVAYLNMGSRKKAQWHFERAITLNASFALARNNLHALQRLIAQER